MTLTRRHSTVFEALRLIRDAIREAGWPTHGDTLAVPDVGIGFDESPDVADERVTVLDRVDDAAFVEWARMTGRNESYPVDIVIDSWVPGQDRDAAHDRLAELAVVVQDLFRDLTTGQAKFPTSPTWWMSGGGGVSRVTCDVGQSTEGWGGRAVVTVVVIAHI